jgi:hypothetical protein
MVMGGLVGLSSTATALLSLLSLGGLLIGLVVFFRRLDWWIERFADLIVQRSERRREKALTKPSLDG